jgi:hypothetical protein
VADALGLTGVAVTALSSSRALGDALWLRRRARGPLCWLARTQRAPMRGCRLPATTKAPYVLLPRLSDAASHREFSLQLRFHLVRLAGPPLAVGNLTRLTNRSNVESIYFETKEYL